MDEGTPQRARSNYSDAWEVLSSAHDEQLKLRVRAAELQSNVVLRQLPIAQFIGESDPKAGGEPDDPAMKGTVSVTYGISDRGRTGEVKLVEAIPPEFVDMQQTVAREVRRRIYRPRYQDGQPIQTTGHLYVHTYWYRQSDLDAARAAIAASDDGKKDK